jgi:sulfite exporter TauE/SafE
MLLKMKTKKFNLHLVMGLVRVYAFKLVGAVVLVVGAKLQLKKVMVKKDLLLAQILVL